MSDLEMQPPNQQVSTHEITTVQCPDRWQVYHRLKALDISCQCKTNRPLQVKLDNTISAIQLWSVTKQCTASRQELVDWLDRCWLLKS